MTHSFFLKLWPEMRLGATVTTRKQNKHRANGKLLILQKQGRPNRFDQMLRSCWLVFLVLMELCTRNLFLLGKPCINNFIWRCRKITQRCTQKKTTRNVEQRWLVPSPRLWPCLHGLEFAAGFGKKYMTAIPHPPYSLVLSPCGFFLFTRMEARWKGNVLLMSTKWKRKRWRSWTTSARKSSRNVFSSGRNVGTSVSSQKESTLQETSFNSIKSNKPF